MDERELRNYRRNLLDAKTLAVSDALDEYLVRIHGILSSWAHPEDFIVWLEERGYTIVKKDEG